MLGKGMDRLGIGHLISRNLGVGTCAVVVCATSQFDVVGTTFTISLVILSPNLLISGGKRRNLALTLICSNVTVTNHIP